MTGQTKQKVLLFFGAAMLLVILMAASLSQLDLQPGLPMPQLNEGNLILASTESATVTAVPVNDFFKYFLMFMVGVSLFYLLYRLIKGTNWKEARTVILYSLLVILAAAAFLFIIVLLLPHGGAPNIPEMPLPQPVETVTAPLGETPPLLILAVIIGLLLSIILLGVWFMRAVPSSDLSINLGIEAEKARQALLQGEDLKNVIIACYQKMSLVLQEDQDIKREVYMTPHEFEDQLKAAGMPPGPVHQLTQLFEAARYGRWNPAPGDEKNAVACLEAIVQFSRAVKESG